MGDPVRKAVDKFDEALKDHMEWRDEILRESVDTFDRGLKGGVDAFDRGLRGLFGVGSSDDGDDDD